MVFMSMFLLFGALKVALLLFFFIALIVYFTVRCVRKRNHQSASKRIVRSLAKLKYSALTIGDQDEAENECSICFVEYTKDCMVTKLECNDKHIFHVECISGWV